MNYDELISIVRDVEPVIRANAAEGECRRRVPAETAEAIRAAGLLKLWVPRELGGWEVEPVAACRIIERIARIDSAAAWMVQMCGTVSLLSAWFDDEAVAEMFEVTDPVFGDSFASPMQIQPVAGGWKVTGQTSFVSNCHNLDWFFGMGMEFDGDVPKPGPEGVPEAKVFAVPRKDFEIVENWNTVGMRGTGSHDVRVEGITIPAHRVAAFPPDSLANNKPYAFTLSGLGVIWLGILSMGSVGLGVAGAAYECFTALCESKTPNYADAKLGETSLTHYRLGEAHANLGAGRAYLYGVIDDVWARVKTGDRITDADRLNLSAASTFAVQSAARAVDLIAESAGTSMVRDENPLSRHGRDLHTLTQHVFTSRNRYQDIGMMLLGMDPIFEMLRL